MSFEGMLVLAAKHGQEDRVRFPKGSPCLGMALVAALYPREVLKWTVPTLHQVMEDGYAAYRRIIDATDERTRNTDYLELYEATALEGKVRIEGTLTSFDFSRLPYSGEIGQEDNAVELETSGLSLETALRRFFEHQTAGVLLVPPYWIGIRRSDLDGVRYAVINTHSVTMRGKIPNPEKEEDWLVYPTAKIHVVSSIQQCAEIIKAGTNGTIESPFMLFEIRHEN